MKIDLRKFFFWKNDFSFSDADDDVMTMDRMRPTTRIGKCQFVWTTKSTFGMKSQNTKLIFLNSKGAERRKIEHKLQIGFFLDPI